MRAPYGSQLRRLFASELKAAGLPFVEVKPQPPDLWPGERAYVYKTPASIWQWLVLAPSQKDDSFRLDLGWSRRQRFPQVGRPSAEAPAEAIECVEYFCELGQLSSEARPWNIDAFLRTAKARDILSAMPGALQSDPSTRVLVSIRACMQQLHAVGLPFLARVA